MVLKVSYAHIKEKIKVKVKMNTFSLLEDYTRCDQPD